MASSTLVVAHGSGCAEHAEALALRVVRHWPGGGRPEVRLLPFGDLLLETKGGTSPTLVVGDDTLVGARLSQMLDALDGRCIPAVLLLPPGLREAVGPTPGVVVWDEGADPALLAPVLYAMGVRQETVTRLNHELAIAHHCQGGMHDEISRVHEEMSLAARIQKDFMLREGLEIDGFEVAVLHQPTGYVSGDMYGVRRVDKGMSGVLIADAVGHGVPAALLTMVIARSVQAAPPHVLADPSVMLARLNADLMAAQSGGTRFVTAVYATVEHATRRVRVAGAGHPPPLWIRSGSVERIETDGPLLGVFEDATFSVTEITMNADETLLLYTDGFETCFPAAETEAHRLRRPTMTYVEHFARLCNPESAASLEEAMAELRATMLEQAGSLHQADDVTALAIAAKRDAGRAAA